MTATTWLWLAIGAGVVAVLYGVFSMMAILKLPAGNQRMQDIASAIRELVNLPQRASSHFARASSSSL